jgi:hypothetical protein
MPNQTSAFSFNVEYPDTTSKDITIDQGNQLANKILGQFILENTENLGTQKNFFKADKPYQVTYEGQVLKLKFPRDAIIISRKTPKKADKEQALACSIRFYARNKFGEREVPYKEYVNAYNLRLNKKNAAALALNQVKPGEAPTISVVRILSEIKFHVVFDVNSKPTAIQREVKHPKLVEEIKHPKDPEKLAEENKNFGLIHNNTGYGNTRPEIYTDTNTSRIVMPRFKGKLLSETITKKELDYTEKLDIISELIQQVQKVHEQNKLITNLSLENLVYKSGNPIKLINTNFVIDRCVDTDLPITYYSSSPEIMIYTCEKKQQIKNQLQNKINDQFNRLNQPPTFSSDIFSLGVVIACILANKEYSLFLSSSISNRGVDEEDIRLTMLKILDNQNSQYSIHAFINEMLPSASFPSELIYLLKRMTNINPKQRPTLEEVKLSFTKIKLQQEGQNYYQQLSQNPNEKLSPEKTKEIQEWCQNIRQLIGDNPDNQDIKEDLASLEIRLNKLSTTTANTSTSFFAHTRPYYLEFLSILKSLCEKLGLKYFQSNQEVKEHEEGVSLPKPLSN